MHCVIVLNETKLIILRIHLRECVEVYFCASVVVSREVIISCFTIGYSFRVTIDFMAKVEQENISFGKEGTPCVVKR